jgi:hypothetical protein
MPVGNRMPKLSVMKKMCIHRMLSTGSNDTDWPGGKSSSWCSWATTTATNNERNERRDRRRDINEPREAIVVEKKRREKRD